MSVVIQKTLNGSEIFFEDLVASVIIFLGGDYSDYHLEKEENEAITYTLDKKTGSYLICGIYMVEFTCREKQYELKLPYQCYLNKETMKVLDVNYNLFHSKAIDILVPVNIGDGFVEQNRPRITSCLIAVFEMYTSKGREYPDLFLFAYHYLIAINTHNIYLFYSANTILTIL